MTPILPFRQFVLKVHSRCDIACDYCYMYEHVDQSWRGRPLAMSDETIKQVAVRIAQHVRAHRLPAVHVVLHGGEPLLFGVERTRRALELLRTEIEPYCQLDLRIHTNAVRLDDAFCDLFAEHGVKVGVSLDGGRDAHDRHRRHANGRSSHDEVKRGLSLLRRERYRHLYSGLLCTVDVNNDPIAVYEALVAEQPPRIDLLLPHATWDRPPPRARRTRASGIPSMPDESVTYADWLTTVYNRWTADGRPFGIRTFDAVSVLLRGLPSPAESLGLEPADLVVVETDGAIEQLDALKTTYAGAPATGLNVFVADFNEAAQHAGVVARQRGLAGLCPTCQQCPLVRICGGGLYPHRYSTNRGFQNPSVYCHDLKAMIVHIQQREAVAPARAVQPTESTRTAHTLPEAHFRELAAGHGGIDAICRLTEAQLSLRRRLLAWVLSVAADNPATSNAAAFLMTADKSAPSALNAMLAHPYTRAWAVRCIEALQIGAAAQNEMSGSTRVRSGRPATGNVGALGASGRFLLNRLNAFALVAAVHGGLEASFEITPVDGALRLPGLGAALVRSERPVLVRHADGVLSVGVGPEAVRVELAQYAPAREPGIWQPIRRLITPYHTVQLDDVDAHRNCHHWAPAARLGGDEVSRWQESFTAAVTFINAYMPAYRDGLRTGLTTLAPLVATGAVGDASATARHAFGAVGAARPDTPIRLALLLVHEFQHMKLGAILDEFDLFDAADTDARYYAAWRLDPRPIEGLLHGAYAHLAVTEFWREVRQVLPDPDRVAETHFVRWRAQTAVAVRELLASDSLTPIGVRFVEAMQATVQPWCEEPVSEAARIEAEITIAKHRAAYEANLAASRPG